MTYHFTAFTEEGRKKGMQEGLQQGMEKGVKKGLEKGIEKGREEVIRNMLKQGFDLNAITKAVGLSKTEVNKIKASIRYPNGA